MYNSPKCGIDNSNKIWYYHRVIDKKSDKTYAARIISANITTQIVSHKKLAIWGMVCR